MGRDGLICIAPRILLPFISPEISLSSAFLQFSFVISNDTQNLQNNQPGCATVSKCSRDAALYHCVIKCTGWSERKKGGEKQDYTNETIQETHTLSLAHTHIPTVKLGGLYNILCCYSNSAPSHGSWGQMLLFCEPMHCNFHLSLFLSRKYTLRPRGFVEMKKVGGGERRKPKSWNRIL